MQRNAYLKETQVEPAVLDIWDRQLAACGSRMMLQRESFIKKINQISSGIHRDITNQKEALKVCYAPNVKLCETEKEQEEFLYQSFQKSLEQDLRQRATTKGPHKDDLEFFINDINVRSFGSQASAIAIMTRCLIPPDNSCGYCFKRLSGSLIPTKVSSSLARSFACFLFLSVWSRIASIIWFPIV